ncbi:MAG TPA: D-cysteine desulfhydrase family protein [Burkholderiaceae bacterium]|nr:D-cysteine desulfhydrase family protein [Burkholderiaceae bacterium]
MATTTRFDRHPRARLVEERTPIQRLHRLEAALGAVLNGSRLFVKRDDLAGFGGGSKVRKLDFLLGEARAAGADTIIATGLRQSNSARAAAAAAARLGLRVELGLRPLTGDDAGEYLDGGNALLDELYGATVRDVSDAAQAAAFIAERRSALGASAYVVPPGASSPVASLGYAEAALEIADQEHELGLRFDRVVVPNGSSSTQAGLVAGFALLGRRRRVQGFSVLARAATAQATTLELARAAFALLDGEGEIAAGDVVVSDAFLGPGYGHTTPEAVEALRFLAAHEGLLLDPVYSAKAFAGLLALIRRGELAPRENVLFVMTGGAPSLFAYRDALSRASRP